MAARDNQNLEGSILSMAISLLGNRDAWKSLDAVFREFPGIPQGVLMKCLITFHNSHLVVPPWPFDPNACPRLQNPRQIQALVEPSCTSFQITNSE
jgi:hypothetical protein